MLIEHKWSLEEIDEWLKEIKESSQPFSEAKALSLLKQLERMEAEEDKTLENGQSKKEKLKSHLYTLLIEKRYERIARYDGLMYKWLEQALSFDPTNSEAKKWQVEFVLQSFVEIDIPTVFPTIRETDHHSAKKERAEQYYQFAEVYFENLERMEKACQGLEQSSIDLEDVPRYSLILQLRSLYKQMEEPFLLILKATKEYAKSISGIYYSAEQLRQIKEATENIQKVAEQWKKQMEQLTSTDHEVSALSQLDKMIGLDPIKARIEKLYQYLQYQKRRTESGFVTKDELSLHMIFTGNPGTGKTTLARLMAKIYYELGLLEHSEVHEVDRSQLVGAYVGQTEEQTLQAIEKASGGVLFIDEAYSLKRSGTSSNDYGQTMIDTLVSAMTNEKKAGTFAVVLAGYPDEMNVFLRSNPGLRSRFPEQNHFHVEDYSSEELLQIGEKVASDNDFLLSDPAKKALLERIERAQVDESFGNARTVKNIILDAIFEKGAKSTGEEAVTADYVLLEEKNFLPEEEKAKEKNAQLELKSLIGLEQVKRELDKLTSFIKVQQLRRKENLPTNAIQLNTIFSGASGTGKTTVAQIYAQVLKELGVLKRGHLVIASRSELVAGYIGQTAAKTKEKIRDALGGVLFIDEAYSLFSDGRGDFGKEAVATLLQEMSTHQENLVVILAGYENEMEALINSNPGIRSRFPKNIVFPSYSQAELQKMMVQKVEQLGYQLTKEAELFLQKIIPDAGHQGNGRFVVNAVEQLIQLQAERIVNEESFEMADLMTLTRSDLQQLVQDKEEE
ncbi:AAA family ATPase [Alkalihalobacillus alcalophilus]|uniref:AAA family ATPase n=1 Tax=Alkalihalobacillus alcalophilus TaxID=1445 RepID=UPI00027BC024|nr:AAA family ATPase [Alkalihalobacillus alcalophilus]MED1562789.1 AAA family ATPase [Alkalihalobacillus alcalophilus]